MREEITLRSMPAASIKVEPMVYADSGRSTSLAKECLRVWWSSEDHESKVRSWIMFLEINENISRSVC